MKSKGFTLIELLAVIVILAIVALIAAPIVLNIIEDARKESNERSAQNYLSALKISLVGKELGSNPNIPDGTYKVMSDGNICIGTLNLDICDGEVLKIEVDGTKPESGRVKIVNGGATNVYRLQYGEDYLTLNAKTGKFERANIWDGSSTTLANIEYDESTKTYTLNSAADLAGIRDAINSGAITGEYNVVLNSDVDMGKQAWVPIGTMSADYDTYDASRGYFEGTFDGNGFTVSNINVTKENSEAVGFFGGVAGNVTIKNLNISGGKLQSNGKTTAGLVAYAIDKTDSVTNITIENCSTDVEVKGADATAGILGRAYNSGIKTVTNCENSGTITGPGNVSNKGKVAGIVGLSNGNHLIISNSKNYGDVTNGYHIGGILGFVNLGNYTIENSINSGTIGRVSEKDFGYNVGGIVGIINTGSATGTINNSKNYGQVYSNKYSGGIVGLHGAPALSVTNSENNGLIKSDDTAGGIGGYIGYGNTSTTNFIPVTGNINNGEINSKNYAGGVVGMVRNVLVQNNTNTGKVTSANSYAGGIVAAAVDNSSANAKIENCVNKGTIASSKSAGGIAGSSYWSIVSCENTGTIKGETLAGGIVGEPQVTKIESSTNSGKVTSSKGTAGGITSLVYSGYINNSANSGIISANNMAGGIVGRTLGDLSINTCQNSGKVNSTGTPSSDNSYLFAAGGIVGSNHSSSYASSGSTIINSSNTGEIEAIGYAGGITGQVLNKNKIENSYNTSSVTSTKSTAGGVVGLASIEQNYSSDKIEILSCNGGTGEIKGSRPGRIIGSASSYEQGGIYLSLAGGEYTPLDDIGNVGGINRHTKIYITGWPTWVNGEPYSGVMKQTSWNSLQIDISIYYNGNIAWQYLSAGTNTWTIRPN